LVRTTHLLCRGGESCNGRDGHCALTKARFTRPASSGRWVGKEYSACQMSAQLGVWQSRTLRRWGARAKQQQGISLLQASILSGRTKRLRRQRHGITSSTYLLVASSRALLKKQPQLGADQEGICSRSRFMTQCPTVICIESPRRGIALRVGMRRPPRRQSNRARDSAAGPGLWDPAGAGHRQWCV
jgi:hypothetical protein